MNLAVRRLQAGDAGRYREIRLEGLRTEPVAFTSDYDREVGRTAEDVGAQLERSFIFGAFDGERLVGLSGYYVEATEKTRHRGHVVGVYVRPEARGKGASGALFEALIASARNRVTQLHLAVVTENEPARRLYERFGFRIYGTDPRGVQLGGRFYDDYLMVLRLDEGSKESDEK